MMFVRILRGKDDAETRACKGCRVVTHPTFLHLVIDGEVVEIRSAAKVFLMNENGKTTQRYTFNPREAD